MNIILNFEICCFITGEDSLIGLATDAARNALEMANIQPDDVDLVLMCTSTGEDLFGSAPQVSFRTFELILMAS